MALSAWYIGVQRKEVAVDRDKITTEGVQMADRLEKAVNDALMAALPEGPRGDVERMVVVSVLVRRGAEYAALMGLSPEQFSKLADACTKSQRWRWACEFRDLRRAGEKTDEEV